MIGFWTLFWCGFALVPLWLLIYRATPSSGDSISTTHIWAYRKGGGKSRDASVRDVYESKHGRGSYDKAQEAGAVILAVTLCVIAIVVISFLLGRNISIPKSAGFVKKLWHLFGPGVLGSLLGAALWPELESAFRKKSRTIKTISLILAGCFYISTLGFVFMLWPFSIHWQWSLLIAIIILNIIGTSLNESKKTREEEEAKKRGQSLDNWFLDYLKIVVSSPHKREDFKDKTNPSEISAELINLGELDTWLNNISFLNRTEEILLWVVEKKPIATDENLRFVKSLRFVNDEIIPMARQVYLRAIKEGWCEIHPKIKEVLESRK